MHDVRQRGLITALFTAIVLLIGFGLYVSASPALITPIPDSAAAPVSSPEPPEQGPEQAQEDAPPAVPVTPKEPALPPADDVPASQGGVRRPVHCPVPPAAPATGPATAARAAGRQLAIYRTPGGQVTKTLANPTRDGMTLVVLVLRHQGAWTLVHHPGRPNGSHGWVQARDIREYEAAYHAVVELCSRRLTLYRAGRVVMQEPVAVGAPQWPTPTGRFYVDYQWQTDRPGGAYGPWLLSIAGYSNVLHHFAGGIGQIAFHGTNAAWSIGKAVSHGCIRLRNDAITRLKGYAVPGTPVTIVS